jgi:hypothetical protein
LQRGVIVKTISLSLAAAAAAFVASAAPAATFVFDTRSGRDGTASFKDFSANADGKADGYVVNMRATAWQATATRTADSYKIASATLGTFTPGLGVLGPGEGYGDAEHQIDNSDGVDFVMLRFSESVNLSGIGRTPFFMSGISPSGTTDSDASFKSTAAGAGVAWDQTVDLSGFTYKPSTFTALDGSPIASGTNYTSAVNTSVFSTTWLVSAAAFKDNNDGFKLSSVSVNFTPAAVPEPATWAMMLVGFGAIGGTLRSRRGRQTVNVTFG